MSLINLSFRRSRQSGASLIEVLVAVLILSFGMLALGGMLSYAVQMPKLSGYRSSATTIAAAHIERMRANVAGFTSGQYASASIAGEPFTYGLETWKTLELHPTACQYPACNSTSIAWADINETHAALRRELPGNAGIRVTCSGACNSMTAPEGDIWVMWADPSTVAGLDPTSSDECPDSTSAPIPASLPKPRCLHLRFKL